MTDDFLTAGHRFDEFGICVEPIPEHQRKKEGNDRCPVRWDDICDLKSTETVWLSKPNIAHTGNSLLSEIQQIEKRKAAITRQVCIASGWRTE